MKQTTKFLHIVMCMVLGLSVSMTSCKDYDDDIDGLNQRVDALEKSLSELSTDFGELAYVKSVTFADGVLTVTPSEGNAQTYTIPDNDTNTTYTVDVKRDGQKVTITLNGSDGSSSVKDFDLPQAESFNGQNLTLDNEGNICYNGVPTGVKLPEAAAGFDESKLVLNKEDNCVYYDGKKTGVELDVFNPALLTVEGSKVLYAGEATGVELPVAPALDIKEIKDGAGAVLGYAITYNGKTTNLKLAPEKLQGLVFIPDFYYQGIEAMAAYTYDYKALENLTAADANGYDDKTKYPKGYVEPTFGEAMSITPNLVAKYHLNPSNVAENLLSVKNMSFLAEDKLYTKGNGVVMPEIVDRKVVDGVLSVSARLSEGMIKDIQEDGSVTVMALQVGTKGEKGDTLITSDYAALKAVTASNFVLSNAKEENTVCQHLHQTLAAAIDAPKADFELLYNAKDGIDVAELIRTHVDREALNLNAPTHVRLDKNAASGEIEQYGFAYEYALIGYTDGVNKTSQSAHAQMNGSMLRAQVVDADGKQLPWGAEQKRSTIGRMPIVRVLLKDVISNEYVAVGYVKFEIVAEETEAPEDKVLHIVNFNFDDAYTSNCDPASFTFDMTWNDIESGIYTALDMSKAEFEEAFMKPGTVDLTTQYKDVTVDAEKVATPVGIVEIAPEVDGGSVTDVLKWTVTNNEAYELFDKENLSISANVRFVRNNSNGTKSYVYVTFTWTPTPLKIEPTGTIDNKFANFWFQQNSNTPGEAEVHFNTSIPGTTAEAEFVNDLNTLFEGGEPKFELAEKDIYTGYVDEKLTKSYVFVGEPTDINVGEGKNYRLKVASDGLSLTAAPINDKGVEIGTYENVATLSGTVITYAQTDNAKAVLNYSGEASLEKALTAKIAVKAVAEPCKRELNITNGTFDVKFLRPLSISVISGNKGLQDGVEDSKINLKDLIEISDWRYPNASNIGLFTATNFTEYAQHYGLTRIDVNVADIRLGDDLLTEVYPNYEDNLTFTPAETLAYSNLGTLAWKNSGKIMSDMTLSVPVTITYKWGTVEVEIPVVVHGTASVGN